MSNDSRLPTDDWSLPDEAVLERFRDRVTPLLERGESIDVSALLPHHPHLVPQARLFVQQFDQQWPHTGFHVPIPDPFPGEFTFRRLLGEGTFGRVWLADDLHLPRQVAFKTVRIDGRTTTDRSLQALLRDAEILTRVHHDNIVGVYFWRRAGETHYLAMQHVEGGSLASLVRREGPLSWQRACRYVADVTEALQVVHAAGVIHRDVKPANILLDTHRDEALLTDFGIAARLGDPATIAGTVPYMAPEAFASAAGPRADVYSLAATLFWLVTGEVPFRGTSEGELLPAIQRGLSDPDPRCRSLPEAIERVIRAGLTANPELRPGLGAFHDLLRGAFNQALVDQLVPPATTTGPVVQMIVRRWTALGTWETVASVASTPEQVFRDMRRVPPRPDRVRVTTGDTIRLEVVATRAGHVSVYNVGPTGNLTLLHPENPGDLQASAVRPGEWLPVLDTEMVPPAGRERLFAVWSRRPLSSGELPGLPGSDLRPGPSRASRDMVRLQQILAGAGAEEVCTTVLELEHVSDQTVG